MMNRMVVAAAVCMTAGPTYAQLNILQDGRSVEIEVETSNSNQANGTMQDQMSPGGVEHWSDDLSSTAMLDGASAFARSALTSSTFNSTELSGVGLTIIDLVDPGAQTSALAIADTDLFAQFSVSSNTVVRVTVELISVGGSGPRVSLQKSGQSPILSMSANDETVNVDQQFVLDPGTYFFTLEARQTFNSSMISSFDIDRSASFNGGLYVVPGPAALTPFALAAGLLARRRR